MSAHPTSYLVLASQRCGSTLLVESLRATGSAGEPQEFFQYLPTTGMAPQPRQWFAGVEDETILKLLDPLEPGTPDTASSVAWREHILSSGRTPNGIWGGKLMWNQTPLLQQRRLVPHQLAAPDAIGCAAGAEDVLAPGDGRSGVGCARLQRIEQLQDCFVLDSGEPLPRLRRHAGRRQILK